MDIYLSDEDFLDLLTALVAYGRSAKDTEQARIGGLIGRVFLNARGNIKPTNTESTNTESVKCEHDFQYNLAASDKDIYHDVYQCSKCHITRAFKPGSFNYDVAATCPASNGGVTCDMDVGPCACGAWHEPKPTGTCAAPNGIVLGDGGDFGCDIGSHNYFKVFVRCQDGIEFCGDYQDIEEARNVWASSSIQMGNKRAKTSDARLYEFKDGKYVEKETK